MAYITATAAGSSVTLSQGDKITSIAGQTRDLYVIELAPYAQGMRRTPRILAPVDVVINPFSSVNSGTLVPTYGTSATVSGQVKTEKAGQWKSGEGSTGPNKGPLAPESKETVYFNNADTTQNFGLIRAVLADAAQGLMFTALWLVQLIPEPTVTVAGNANLGVPDTVTAGTPVTLTPIEVDLTDQFTSDENARIKRGDAKIVIPRTTSQATLENPAIYFDITPLGGSAIRYQLWAKGSLEAIQTYHWCVYLKRVRP